MSDLYAETAAELPRQRSRPDEGNGSLLVNDYRPPRAKLGWRRRSNRVPFDGHRVTAVGPGFFVPLAFLPLLLKGVRLATREDRKNGLNVDQEVLDMLGQLEAAQALLNGAADVLTSSAAEVSRGSAPSYLVTPEQLADARGVSPQAITKACREGRIKAEQDDRGRWRIDAAELEAIKKETTA